MWHMDDRRRARVTEYAQRVNRAVGLLARVPPATARQTLARHFRISSRQASRYVQTAQQHPRGLPVPEPTVVFTVKLPVSVVRRVRALARATGVSLSALVTRALTESLRRRPRSRGGG